MYRFSHRSYDRLKGARPELIAVATPALALSELAVSVEWGGDWSSFRDGPHWQLPWKEYPA